MGKSIIFEEKIILNQIEKLFETNLIEIGLLIGQVFSYL